MNNSSVNFLSQLGRVDKNLQDVLDKLLLMHKSNNDSNFFDDTLKNQIMHLEKENSILREKVKSHEDFLNLILKDIDIAIKSCSDELNNEIKDEIN